MRRSEGPSHPRTPCRRWASSDAFMDTRSEVERQVRFPLRSSRPRPATPAELLPQTHCTASRTRPVPQAAESSCSSEGGKGLRRFRKMVLTGELERNGPT